MGGDHGSNEDGKVDDDGDGKISPQGNNSARNTTDIVLPTIRIVGGGGGGENINHQHLVLQSWKSKPGSLVRVGETIAVACSAKKTNDDTSSNTASVDPASGENHKRPNRRRRVAPPSSSATIASATASKTTSSAPYYPHNSNSRSDPFASIQQRLAAKLSSENNSSSNNTSSSSSSSSSSKKGIGSSAEEATSAAPTLSSAPSSALASSSTPNKEVPILAPATGLLRIFPNPITRKASASTTDEGSSSPSSSSSSSSMIMVIGCIEPCRHPAFLEGLCVVCGESIIRNRGEDEEDEDDQQVNSPNVPLPSYEALTSGDNSHIHSSSSTTKPNKVSQVTVSGGVTMTVSADESREMAQRENERLLHQAKLSLVLDLDHTLVHATADPRAQQFHGQDDVRTLRLPAMEGVPAPAGAGASIQAQSPAPSMMYMQHHVKLRPHIRTFLQSVQKDYELTVYTAGTRQYAEEITIVLCRHLVGSNRDIDDLERLRYDVHMAEVEFQRLQSLNDKNPVLPITSAQTTTTCSDDNASEIMPTDDPNADDGGGGGGGGGGTKKRKQEDDTTTTKRKKVSFGAPQDNEIHNDQQQQNDDTDGLEDRKLAATTSSSSKQQHLKSDHMTKDRLDALKKELADAEALEKKAWEARQKVFGSRVVSRTDVGDLGRDVKSLRRIFPCGGTMAAVVDDREDVWANAVDNSNDTIKGEPPDNLLLVRPYHWKPFIGFADVNNSAGEDLSGEGNDNNTTADPAVETDVQLIWTTRILKGLHRRYYRQDLNNRKTVPELLAQMRSQVLRDATLVLSGLVPLHKQSLEAHQARPPIVRYAQALGAKLVDQVGPGVTHVVAAKDGTDKCLAARKTPDCVLVKAAWLVECYWSMTRRDVQLHLINNNGADANINISNSNSNKSGGGSKSSSSAATANKQQLQPAAQSLPISNTTTGGSSDISSTGSDEEDDGDDDDFAAAFEDEMMKS